MDRSRLPSALSPSALLRRLDPETAHRVAVAALRFGLAGHGGGGGEDPILATQVLGLRFANPIGLAAGFDKDGVAARGLARLGFGFLEVGTVTPRPQKGNPRPRLFRLDEDRAIVNRMGFNNAGLPAMRRHLARLPPPFLSKPGARVAPVGVNVGINKEGADPERDYPRLIRGLAPFADYMVLNISSPNTPGLRDLQSEARLRLILAAIAAEAGPHPPLLLKLAPDLPPGGLEAIVETAVAGEVAGLILTNTTLARAGLRSSRASEGGGLSGAPLFARATAVLAEAYELAAGRLALIGVGGVETGEQALAKIKAGADLVQIYTGFVHRGPEAARRIADELAAALRREGFASVAQAVGAGR